MSEVPVKIALTTKGAVETKASLDGVANSVAKVQSSQTSAASSSNQLAAAVAAVNRSAPALRENFATAADTVTGFRGVTMAASSAMRGDFVGAAQQAVGALRQIGLAIVAHPVLAAVAAITIAITALSKHAEKKADEMLAAANRMADGWVKARDKMRNMMGRGAENVAKREAAALAEAGNVGGIEAAMQAAEAARTSALNAFYEASKGDDVNALEAAERQAEMAERIADMWKETYDKITAADAAATKNLMSSQDQLALIAAKRAGKEGEYWLDRYAALTQAAQEFRASTEAQTAAGKSDLVLQAEQALDKYQQLQDALAATAEKGDRTAYVAVKPEQAEPQKLLGALEFGSQAAQSVISQFSLGGQDKQLDIEKRQLTTLERIDSGIRNIGSAGSVVVQENRI